MSVHSMEKQQLLHSFATNPETGLSKASAEEGLRTYGLNQFAEKKKKGVLQRFLDQFRDVMILILLLAAAVSFGIACYEGNPKEFFEPVLIVLIVVLNAIMGVVQESKAEKALSALKSMSVSHARVIRDGQELVIEAEKLVPGDIIKLEAGDFVPADARLIQSSSLKSEESALTGESVPSEKDADTIVSENAPLGDRVNMVYSGCSIAYGTAVAVVCATGMQTEMGKIANLLNESENIRTPLQKKLAQLGKYLGIVALVACGIIFLVGLVEGLPVLDMFMTAVSLAVSAIPEGLPAIVTIVLSIGVQRMVKKNAIIRRLPAVETLGGASVICSDKTGTLTQNRMTLVEAYSDASLQSECVGTENTEEIRTLLIYGTLCSDGVVMVGDDGVRHIGDPTETAIVYAAYQNGIHREEIFKKYPRLGEIPFDSDRKLMTSVNEIDGKITVIVKGAFDVLSTRCISGNTEHAKKVSEEMSSRALRVIGVAYKILESTPQEFSSEALESDLTFLGLVGMIDPPRSEAREAVALCKKAGIKPVMITGDHVATASAIARELGILSEGDHAVTGAELDAMTEEELDRDIGKISVYARVSPENKIRIVRAWQKKDAIVSMTGDGVNDAPALKAADIGCAMGITGTDVAKGASDIILTDDNFATIVDAIKEGRGIYSNIRKVVGFLLGTNIGEVLAVLFAMLFWKQTPLLSMQLLWINLVTDSMPAIALGMEPVEEEIMSQPPKPKNEGLFSNGLGIRIVLQGVMFAVLCLIGFYHGWKSFGDSHAGQTMAFLVLSVSQVIQAYNLRSHRSLFKTGLFGNKSLNLSVLISLGLIALVVFTPVSVAFGLVILTPAMYWKAIGLALVPVVVMELFKAFGLVKQ